MDESTPVLPKAFKRRRMHSLMGLWLVIFLIEHLITNSQAALYVGNDGAGFIQMVNFLHSVPYLQFVEVGLLGIPILYHAWWGVQYLREGRSNSWPGNGASPVQSYARNHRYTWQRITSWILLVAVALHVVQMRFIDFPVEGHQNGKTVHMVRVTRDDGLVSVARRVGATVYEAEVFARGMTSEGKLWELNEDEVIVASEQFGVAVLMSVRDTFKSPLMMGLYTVFVLAAAYHALNGLWTFMITWGITLTKRSQALMSCASIGMFILLAFLGLASVFGTYYLNLYR
jgi:succinate dehydrogenase / fumarate reductase cytochrome b subunit